MLESKEALQGRLDLLVRSNLLKEKHNQSRSHLHTDVAARLRALIQEESIRSYLALESYYSFLLEKAEEDNTKMETYVQEIRDFVL